MVDSGIRRKNMQRLRCVLGGDFETNPSVWAGFMEASTGLATIFLSHCKTSIIEREVELCVALCVTLVHQLACFCQRCHRPSYRELACDQRGYGGDGRLTT